MGLCVFTCTVIGHIWLKDEFVLTGGIDLSASESDLFGQCACGFGDFLKINVRNK